MFTTVEYEPRKTAEIQELLDRLDERYKTLKTEIYQYTEEPKNSSPQAFCLALDKERLINLVKCERRVYSLLPHIAYTHFPLSEDEDEYEGEDDENEDDEENDYDDDWKVHDDKCPTEFGKFANSLICYTKCLVGEQCKTVTGETEN